MKFKRNNDGSYVFASEGVAVKIWRHCRTKRWVARVSFTLGEVEKLKTAKMITGYFVDHMQRWLG